MFGDVMTRAGRRILLLLAHLRLRVGLLRKGR
jgi:hypothetical protein